ncbi:MAG: hypothetical protein IKA17_00170 [Clostridia bacterium]|nr:hypothetical protein [Clostridia bacterium]
MAFKEYMIKRKAEAKSVAITIAAYVVAAILGVLVYPYILKFLGGGIALLVLVGFIYIAFQFTSRLNKEFEYICTEDCMDIDVIMNKSKRKRLLTFNTAQIEVIANVNDSQYNNLLSGSFDKKIDATSGRKGVDVYFAIVEKDGRTLLKFEAPKEMLEMMQKYARSKIHL